MGGRANNGITAGFGNGGMTRPTYQTRWYCYTYYARWYCYARRYTSK